MQRVMINLFLIKLMKTNETAYLESNLFHMWNDRIINYFNMVQMSFLCSAFCGGGNWHCGNGFGDSKGGSNDVDDY